MHKLMDLKEKLCKELEEFSNKTELNTSDLQTIDWLSHSLKSIETVLAMEGYSNDYNPTNSYGGRARDDMGRYSRTYPTMEYSRSYSYGKDSMINNLREMLSEAKTEQERNAISRCINDINY